MMKNISLIILLLIIQICCKPKDVPTECSRKTIYEFFKKYPQLEEKDFNPQLLENIRTVKTKQDIELQMWSPSKITDDNQSICILKNSKGQCYPIPLLSNKYRDYWDFYADAPLKEVKGIPTTFEKEIFNALDYCGFRDTTGTCKYVIVEIFFTLLHTQDISVIVKDALLRYDDFRNFDLPNEESDSCTKRCLENYKAIRKLMTPLGKESWYIIENARWDSNNKRVYQIIDDDIYKPRGCNFSIKVYRQDCNIHGIGLL